MEVTMKHIFIEGLQGAGKSTLLNYLQSAFPDSTAYREGDLSPIELAWCSYLTKNQYDKVCNQYPELVPEFESHSMMDGEHRIIAYTQILTDIPGFHKDMEQYEIYNGNVSFEEFRDIILRRYRNLGENRDLFECSLFQNAIECMILYYQMKDEEIIQYYREVYEILSTQEIGILYIEVENIRENILNIKTERVDNKGNEVWFSLLLQYIETSPYGKAHHLQGLEGLVRHLEHRKSLERYLLENIFSSCSMIVKQKKYSLEEVIHWCR